MPIVIEDQGKNFMQQYLMQMLQRQEERRQMEREAERQGARFAQVDEMTRNKAIADQFRALPLEQQQAAFQTLPEGARQYVMNPGAIPMTLEEQLKRKATQDSIERFGGIPDYVRDAGTYQTAYGKEIPKESNTTLIEQRTLPPEDFQKSRQIDAGLAMDATDEATTGETKRHNIVGEGFEGTKTQAYAANQYAGATANRAQAGKFSAEAQQVGKPKPATPGASFTPERQLREEYRKEVKNFPELQDNLARIKEAAKDHTGQSDVALIFSFMKLNDPGSVVRESEQALILSAGSWHDKAKVLMNKVQNGHKLSDTQRAQIAALSERLYKATEPRMIDIQNKYRGIANHYGLDPERVVGNAAPGDAGAPRIGDKKTFPNGRVGVWDGTGYRAQ
jgi:DNA-binding protein H-NS